jgi:hypothetical protein
MIPRSGKVGRPVGVRYISHEAENGERVANKRVYSPTAGFTALRHLRPPSSHGLAKRDQGKHLSRLA